MTVSDTSYRAGVYGWSPLSGGVHYFRIAEPLRVLADNGVKCQTGQELDDHILDQVDTVLVHTLHHQYQSEAWQKLAKLDTHRLIIDIDDWMWDPDYLPFRHNYNHEALARLFDNVRVAHVVTTPSPVIAEYLTKYNPNVWYVPNTIPAWLLEHQMPRQLGELVVGYQGSQHHIRDWSPSIDRQLVAFLNEHPNWLMHVYGDGTQGSDRVRRFGWNGGVEDYWRSMVMDVGIGPLRSTPFNRAKSALRAIEYAALGIVAVLPDLDPYRGWVEDGVTGRLVHSHQTLRGVLAEVAAGPADRVAMATAARTRAAQWTTEANIDKWVTAWQSR